MRYTTTTNLLAAAAIARVAATTGELGDALVVEDNPVGAVYHATLDVNPYFTPDTPSGGHVTGEVTASTGADGEGVEFKVEFQNLPKEGGPFGYHIHVDPVPSDGNCTLTLAHLDPYIRGEDPECDSSCPETCQVGDLSGKYGAAEAEVEANGTSFETTFWDGYLATYEGPGAFFGNRSIVLHFANKTRIACANFELVDSGVTVDGEGEGTECGAVDDDGVPTCKTVVVEKECVSVDEEGVSTCKTIVIDEEDETNCEDDEDGVKTCKAVVVEEGDETDCDAVDEEGVPTCKKIVVEEEDLTDCEDDEDGVKTCKAVVVDDVVVDEGDETDCDAVDEDGVKICKTGSTGYNGTMTTGDTSTGTSGESESATTTGFVAVAGALGKDGMMAGTWLAVAAAAGSFFAL